ncbi:MAG: hypothetical protein ABR562_10060, partial [Thermoplasmatota archaeon]
LVRLEGLRERARGVAAVLRERSRSLERELRSSLDEDVIASLEAESARATAELTDVDAQIADVRPRAEGLVVAEAELAAARRLTGKPIAVNILLPFGRAADFKAAEAADAVARFRASPASIALLRDVSSADAKPAALVDRLRQMLARRPRERSLMFALADVLSGEGRAAEARALL